MKLKRWGKRTARFVRLPLVQKKTLLEALWFLSWARIQRQRPFVKTARLLGTEMDETSHLADESTAASVRTVARAIHAMAEYTVWESSCLVRAIAAMKMLERRQVASTLYFGVSKDTNGKMKAHAWLRSGPFVVTGAAEMNKYTPIGMFAKKVEARRVAKDAGN